MGEDIAQRKRIISEEIIFLETLVEEMKEGIEEMKYTQAMEANVRTTMGKMRSWIGVVFSIILLARLYFAYLSIWDHWSRRRGTTTDDAVRAPKRDPVTTFLLWMTWNNMVSEKEYNALSQFISLLLTAYLSLSQVRYLLRTTAAIHRRINHLFCGSVDTARSPSNRTDASPRNDGNTSSPGFFLDESTPFEMQTGVYMHLVAVLMGSYFMSCIVLTKMMLPWQYQSAFSGALGGFDAFIIQSDVVNTLFAFSAVVSAIILAMLFGIQKQRALLHSAAWKEDQSMRPMTSSRRPEV
jgi:hypothetical protein